MNLLSPLLLWRLFLNFTSQGFILGQHSVSPVNKTVTKVIGCPPSSTPWPLLHSRFQNTSYHSGALMFFPPDQRLLSWLWIGHVPASFSLSIYPSFSLVSICLSVSVSQIDNTWWKDRESKMLLLSLIYGQRQMYRTSLIYTEGEKKKESNKKRNTFFLYFKCTNLSPLPLEFSPESSEGSPKWF